LPHRGQFSPAADSRKAEVSVAVHQAFEAAMWMVRRSHCDPAIGRMTKVPQPRRRYRDVPVDECRNPPATEDHVVRRDVPVAVHLHWLHAR
jgi:hypothetical protein